MTSPWKTPSRNAPCRRILQVSRKAGPHRVLYMIARTSMHGEEKEEGKSPRLHPAPECEPRIASALLGLGHPKKRRPTHRLPRFLDLRLLRLRLLRRRRRLHRRDKRRLPHHPLRGGAQHPPRGRQDGMDCSRPPSEVRPAAGRVGHTVGRVTQRQEPLLCKWSTLRDNLQ